MSIALSNPQIYKQNFTSTFVKYEKVGHSPRFKTKKYLYGYITKGENTKSIIKG